MKLNITIEVWKKRNWFIAKCPELDFISQGKTHEEAKENLLEVIRIQFVEMAGLGTLDEYLGEPRFGSLSSTDAVTRENRDHTT